LFAGSSSGVPIPRRRGRACVRRIVVTNGTLAQIGCGPASDAGLARLASSIAPAGNVSGAVRMDAMRLMARGELTLAKRLLNAARGKPMRGGLRFGDDSSPSAAPIVSPSRRRILFGLCGRRFDAPCLPSLRRRRAPCAAGAETFDDARS